MKHFNLAAKLASCSEHDKRHGAVIAKGSRVLGMGVNSKKTHPRSTKVGHTIHAELAAVISSGGHIDGATLYSARVLKSGQLANSKPCAHCMALLSKHRIRAVVYFDGYKVVKLGMVNDE